MIAGKPQKIYSIISDTLGDKQNLLKISELCRLANVSRSGYYKWLRAEAGRMEREEADRQDFSLIAEAYRHRGYKKGARSIYMRLLHRNPPVHMNIKKIRRLMKKYGLDCPIRHANPYRRMARAMRTNTVAPNLVQRRFTDYGPRKILLTDITYIPFRDRFFYLSTVLDAYTRQVLSYVLSDSLKVDFVLETIERLVRKHGITLESETIINSDQGCHYTSYPFIRIVRDSDLRQSMSRKGNCWDNAPQESFFGHMKDEIDITGCNGYQDVKSRIDDWMDYYNKERYQWELAKLSPDEYWKYIKTGRYPLDIALPKQQYI